MVFVFASVAMVNANNSVKIENFNNYSELDNAESVLRVNDCFDIAWEYGTFMGDGDPYLEWYFTNRMYDMCKIAEQL